MELYEQEQLLLDVWTSRTLRDSVSGRTRNSKEISTHKGVEELEN